MIPNEDGVLFSTPLKAADSADPRSSKPMTWRHMCALQSATRRWLEDDLELDQNVVDAMLATGTRPRILVREGGVMLNLRGINLNDPEHPEDMISLRIWIDSANIVTCRRRDLRAVEDVIALFNDGRGPTSAGELVTMITTRMFDRIAPYLEDLERCVEESEDALEQDKGEDVTENAALIRRRTAIYRRHIVPQVDILAQLAESDFEWLSEEQKEDVIESHDQVMRYTEILKDIKERTQILNEEIRSLQADRLNGTAYLFSVAATIFLPLSFLTGLMGINVGGMPGMDDDWAFWVFAVLCAGLVAVQIALFRKKNWF